MYFSLIKAQVGQELPAARHWADAETDHKWIWQFFNAERGSPRRFVFHRVDTGQLPYFYLVSDELPTSPVVHWQVHSKPYAPQVAQGTMFDFELRANPVITRSQGSKKQRHDVVMQAKRDHMARHGVREWKDLPPAAHISKAELTHQACCNWLLARAEQIGVEWIADSLQVDAYRQVREKRKPEKGQPKPAQLCYSTVDFSGSLVVRDPARFVQALHGGVGHAKAFGCGLLLVKPASPPF